jgi:Flp pilus assembly protein TadG
VTRQRAQGSVEFALVASVLFLFFFVILDGGRLIYTYQTVAEAAREGAHQAEIIESTDANIRTAISAHSGLLGDLGSTATISPTPARTAKSNVTVTVTYQWKPVTPMLNQFGPINFTASTVVVAE